MRKKNMTKVAVHNCHNPSDLSVLKVWKCTFYEDTLLFHYIQKNHKIKYYTKKIRWKGKWYTNSKREDISDGLSGIWKVSSVNHPIHKLLTTNTFLVYWTTIMFNEQSGTFISWTTCNYTPSNLLIL